MPSWHYDTPSGKVGRRFIGALVKELHGIWERRRKSERFILFQTVIMKLARHVTISHAIWRRIEKRLDAWKVGQHRILVYETLRHYAQYIAATCREESEEHREKTHHSLVLRGKLRMAMWRITDRDTGGVL